MSDSQPCAHASRWDSLHRQFLLDKRASGRAAGSLKYYEMVWNRFRQFYLREQLDRALIREYLVHLQLTCNPVSVNTYWRGLKVFFRWCVAEELVPDDLSLKIVTPRAGHRKKQPLTELQVSDLFDAGGNRRDKAIVALLMDTGIRNRELRELRIEDVDLEQRRVIVEHGKGDKQRSVPISGDALRVLRRWMFERDQDSAWFFHMTRADLLGQQMTTTSLRRVIEKLGSAAGVNANPHLLRHSFAHSYLMQGGDVLTLQALMGHSSLAVTERYVNLSFEDLRRKHDERSPFARVRRAGRGS